MTEKIVDDFPGSVLGRSTVDLIVRQWDRNTRSVSESDVKVHSMTATLQVLVLCT